MTERLMHATCPACRFDFQDRPLYQLADVPVQSVRLVADVESALSFPRGTLTLLDCPNCGLVFNRDFQPESQRWDPDYEETQACSGHFNQFAAELAEQLVQRFDLKNKRILEIGCGKGHFLAALCRGGRNKGLGVDPAFDPARNPDGDASVTFLQEPLRVGHLDFAPDLIVCRHTLEHIADPGGLLSILSSYPDCDIVVEVPNLGRILAEGAFWDLYYEHCSNYDRQSLAATLNRFGIACPDVALCFNDQYLLATGRTGSTPIAITSVTRSQAAGQRISQSVIAWRERLENWQANDESVVLWGGGSKAVAFLSGVGSLASAVAAVVDINPRKQGCFLPGTGHAVLAPADLAGAPPDHIVIMNPAYRGEIAAEIAKLGITVDLVDVNEMMSN